MKLPEIKNIMKYKYDGVPSDLKLKGCHKIKLFLAEIYILTAQNMKITGGYYNLNDNQDAGAIVIDKSIFIRYIKKGRVIKTKKFISQQFIATIAHESLHAITDILKGERITNINESEELFCHLLGALTAEVFDVIINK